MFVLTLSRKGEDHYWQGRGYFTQDVDEAKEYPTWQKANYWAGRIKKWSVKFESVEDIEMRQDEQSRINSQKGAI